MNTQEFFKQDIETLDRLPLSDAMSVWFDEIETEKIPGLKAFVMAAFDCVSHGNYVEDMARVILRGDAIEYTNGDKVPGDIRESTVRVLDNFVEWFGENYPFKEGDSIKKVHITNKYTDTCA